MANVIIRSAGQGDASAIASIHVQSWRDAYASLLEPEFLRGPIEAERLSHWTEMFASRRPGQVLEVAEDQDHRLVGFVCALSDADPQLGSRVDNLHVLPSLRGQQIGERLLREAARRLREEARLSSLHLWVFETNEKAIRFYLRLDGKIVAKDVSRIPAAGRKPVVCIHWTTLTRLAGL
ncbi:MAG: GNAT family N-acetyltransferase [Pseudomonadota bacterium]|nr:GNAT family N-acetyltransferase [Pseudomonadota bacterium]